MYKKFANFRVLQGLVSLVQLYSSGRLPGPSLSNELYFTGIPNLVSPSFPAFHGCREDWSKGRNGVGA